MNPFRTLVTHAATLAFAALVGSATTRAQTVTFPYTGAMQSYTLPPGTIGVTITAAGAKGGDGAYRTSGTGRGGNGALATATFAVTGGAVLRILVGGRGASNAGFNPTGGGGGGGTYVTIGTSDAAFATPLLVAAGGGGGGGHVNAGAVHGRDGGLLIGGNGTGGNAQGLSGGGGGILTAGDGGNAGGRAAIQGGGQPTSGHALGGYGGGGSGGTVSLAGDAGGGGGYSGGGGQDSGQAARGGKSYWDAAATAVLHIAGGALTDDGSVTIVVQRQAASHTSVGQGCGQLALVGSPAPVLATVFTATAAFVPPGTPFSALGIGLSDTSAGGSPLPFDLGGLGAPGCSIYNDMSFGAFFLMTPLQGSSQFQLAIPGDASLAGLRLYQQAWYPSPTANSLGIVTSNGLELQLGF